MFPDIRLMIAAVVASVVALSCGFGVFAALRVNHEPLSRLPSVTAPLQLVPDNVAGPMVLSSHPSLAVEPEVATAAADEVLATTAAKRRPPLPRLPNQKLPLPARRRKRQPCSRQPRR